MVLDIETAGALVPGRTPVRKEVTVLLQRVKILRTFIGLPPDAKVGSILEISKALAVQAKDAHKVEFLPDEKPIETIQNFTDEGFKVEAKADLKEVFDNKNIGHSKKK